MFFKKNFEIFDKRFFSQRMKATKLKNVQTSCHLGFIFLINILKKLKFIFFAWVHMWVTDVR